MGSVTDLKRNKTIFIPCDCKKQILYIEYDHLLKTADLAIYENFISYSGKMSLWQRFLYCWRVLIYKKPYADQINISKNQILELKCFLGTLDLN